MPRTFTVQIGDKVAYSAKWLRDTGPVSVLVFNTIYGFAPAAQMTLEVR